MNLHTSGVGSLQPPHQKQDENDQVVEIASDDAKEAEIKLTIRRATLETCVCFLAEQTIERGLNLSRLGRATPHASNRSGINQLRPHCSEAAQQSVCQPSEVGQQRCCRTPSFQWGQDGRSERPAE